MQGKFLILVLVVNVANDILVFTGKLVLAVDRKLTYVKLDQEHISSISIQVIILLHSLSYNQLRYNNTFCTDAPVCSVVYSHDGGKLAVGLSTGEVEVFNSTSYHHLFTLRDPVACTEVRLHV